jgi:glycosyltransferase involved in cell wall biosynthesis
MNIGIDARLLSGKMTGISRYLWNLIRFIPLYDKKNKYYLYTYDKVNYENDFYTFVPTQKEKISRQIYSHYWLNFILPKYLGENKIDLFFTPYLLVPLKKRNYKNVITIHDSMPRACKEYYSLHYRKYMEFILPIVIERSDAIVTVSESARRDIIKYNNVSEEKIHYVHFWTDDKYKPRDCNKIEKELLLKKYNLPENYILYVGAIEKRKNIEGILKISDILSSRGVDIKFVLIGNGGFGCKPLYEEMNKRRDRIIHLHGIDEQDLPIIYNLAQMFLFPSFYEGFGSPPLEAMKSGIPVLASNNSSLIEVVGEGGLLGDPIDYNFFVKNIIELLNDKDFHKKMAIRSLEQAKKFTHAIHIPKLISIFNDLEK